VAVGVVRTSLVVVGLLVVGRVVGNAPTVVVEPSPPLRPALTSRTAIVTAARNAAGAP
jgi:hypothetical protein